jgi:trehalose 6-phosphate phosphatase
MRVIRPLFSEIQSVCARLDSADRVLIALDYDGTLAPIAESPEGARLPGETAEVLRDLASSERYTVAVVSGRSLADLKERLGLDVIYVGNHGLEMEGPGFSYVHPGAENLRASIDHTCWDLEAALHGVRGVQVERKELSATVHYRQAPPELSSWIQATVNATVRPYLSKLFVGPALQAWEVRPRLHWNKGSAVRVLLGRLEAERPALVCAGDDATDEDMFDLLRWEISIKMGSPRNTRARFYVNDVAELLEFLRVLEQQGRAADWQDCARPSVAGMATAQL